MEPNEHNGPERNPASPLKKDTTEIAPDDNPSDESKGSSKEGSEEPETNQTNFSLNNLRQSKKLSLLDSANTKDQMIKSQVGFGFSEKLGLEYSDPLQKAADFFSGQNPYSPNDSKIRCTSDYVEPSLSTTLKNRYSTPSNAVGVLTRTILGALATAKKVAEGATVAEAVAGAALTPELITIGAISAAFVAIPELLGINEQRNTDLKAAEAQQHIRCRESY